MIAVTRVVALVLAVSMSAGCPPPGVVRDGAAIPRDSAADADLRAARGAIERGDDPQARRVLERFLDDLGTSPRSDEARFLLAEIYLRQGDAEGAAAMWQRLVERAPRSRRAPEARLRAAQVYRDLGKPEIARQLLADADVSRAPPKLRVELLRTLADVARASGSLPEAVVALARAANEVTDARARADIELELAELVEERLREDELEAAAALLSAGELRTQLLLEIGRRLVARGEFRRALVALEQLPPTLGGSQELLRARLLRQATGGAADEMFPLGLAVPLTGPYSSFGRSVLRGVSLGLELYGQEPGQFRLLVEDSGGDPERAVAATEALVAGGARGVIGLMRSVEAASAAPVAEAARVPTLSLAARSDLAYLGPHIFRLGVTPEEQVRAVAEFSMEALEARRFAILYPRDDYGRDYKNLFWEEVERRGGTIVGVEGYEPGAVDIQTEIRKLVGLHYLTADERTRIRRRDRLARRRDDNEAALRSPELAELPPYVDFDALFIPDGAAQIGVILPQLRFYDIADVTIMGPSDWNDPKLLELAANEAEGSVFVDRFYPQSRDPLVQQFVARYREVYDEPPDTFAAEGYDAARLLKLLVEGQGALSAADLTRGLLGFPATAAAFRSVAGLRAFDAVGGSLRQLSVLTVKRRKIQEYGR
jgi:ABC-type branched-subunit amino acid transport system substrate-binding protein/Tfp pilus assembly protein PilF